MLFPIHRSHHLLRINDQILVPKCLPSTMLLRRISPAFFASTSSFSSSSSSTSESPKKDEGEEKNIREEYWKPPEGMVKPAWYRRTPPGSTSNILSEETLTPADETLSGWRLQSYYKMQELVNMMPTVKEKIDLVNPYERDWSQYEKKWHRRWMQQTLLRPRTAWCLRPTPTYFASLDFYKYITKTRLATDEESEQKFNFYFKNLTLPTSRYEKRVTETLILHLERKAMAEREKHPEEEATDNRAKFLRSLIDDAHLVLAHGNSRILEHRISHADRCESFWVRAGFHSLYEQLPVWETDESQMKIRRNRITGDDRRRLGELAFTMRDNHAVQVRSKNPMKKLFDWSDESKLKSPVFPDSFNVREEVIYSPRMFNLLRDTEPLWQCPGYEYDSDETHQFGRLAIKDVHALYKRLDEHWRCDSEVERREVLEECLAATAVSSLFNWLNGQAHCLGHTQYTEIQNPLNSQLVLSDGHQMFYFALGQLNTIAINMEVEGFDNPRTNYCCVEGPFNLYDQFDREKGKFQYLDAQSGKMVDGLNPHVLERLLQMCVVH